MTTIPPNDPTCSKIATHEGGEASTSQHWMVNLRGGPPFIVTERSHRFPLPGRNSRKMLRDIGSLLGTIITCLVGFGVGEDQFRRKRIARRRLSSKASADNMPSVPSRRPGIGRSFSRISICIKRFQRLRDRVTDSKLLHV